MQTKVRAKLPLFLLRGSQAWWQVPLRGETSYWSYLCLLKNVCYQCFVIYSHLTDNVLHLSPPGTTVSGICFLSSYLRLFIGSVQSSSNFLVLTFVFSDFEFVLVQIVASVQNLQSSLHMRSPGFLRLKITLTLLILFQCGF